MLFGFRNKTALTILTATLGSTGIHRFILFGKRDFLAWMYASFFTLYACFFISSYFTDSRLYSMLAVFPLTAYAAFVEALVFGLTPDNKWDARFNPHRPARSASGWPLIVCLVLTLACGFVALVTGLARATDLYLTGGSFG